MTTPPAGERSRDAARSRGRTRTVIRGRPGRLRAGAGVGAGPARRVGSRNGGVGVGEHEPGLVQDGRTAREPRRGAARCFHKARATFPDHLERRPPPCWELTPQDGGARAVGPGTLLAPACKPARRASTLSRAVAPRRPQAAGGGDASTRWSAGRAKVSASHGHTPPLPALEAAGVGPGPLLRLPPRVVPLVPS